MNIKSMIVLSPDELDRLSSILNINAKELSNPMDIESFRTLLALLASKFYEIKDLAAWFHAEICPSNSIANNDTESHLGRIQRRI